MPYQDKKPFILVVEDDTLVRMVGVDMLEEAGFEVLEARDADEAVSILRQHDDIQLLFSDVDMPGTMDGVELARLVHARWPDIRLLLTSGKQGLSEAALPDSGKFVSKPWTRSVLIDKIREMLEG